MESILTASKFFPFTGSKQRVFIVYGFSWTCSLSLATIILQIGGNLLESKQYLFAYRGNLYIISSFLPYFLQCTRTIAAAVKIDGDRDRCHLFSSNTYFDVQILSHSHICTIALTNHPDASMIPCFQQIMWKKNQNHNKNHLLRIQNRFPFIIVQIYFQIPNKRSQQFDLLSTFVICVEHISWRSATMLIALLTFFHVFSLWTLDTFKLGKLFIVPRHPST